MAPVVAGDGRDRDRLWPGPTRVGWSATDARTPSQEVTRWSPASGQGRLPAHRLDAAVHAVVAGCRRGPSQWRRSPANREGSGGRIPSQFHPKRRRVV